MGLQTQQQQRGRGRARARACSTSHGPRPSLASCTTALPHRHASQSRRTPARTVDCCSKKKGAEQHRTAPQRQHATCDEPHDTDTAQSTDASSSQHSTAQHSPRLRISESALVSSLIIVVAFFGKARCLESHPIPSYPIPSPPITSPRTRQSMVGTVSSRHWLPLAVATCLRLRHTTSISIYLGHDAGPLSFSSHSSVTCNV